MTNKAQLIEMFGKNVANTVLSFRSKSMKRSPSSVSFVDKKPAFYVNDGGTLHGYVVDLETGKVLHEKYCGSGDTVMCHLGDMFAVGQQAAGNIAVMYVETAWNGRNHSWFLTVVSSCLTKQIGSAS